MEFLLDTANIAAIEKYNDIYNIENDTKWSNSKKRKH